MPINAKAPVVIPEMELDKYWMQSIRIMAAEVGGEAWAEVTLVPYNANGEKDYSRIKIHRFDNIMSQIASGNQLLAAALNSIMAAVQAKENE